ncbi:Endonuclease V [Stylophora pistillata]|uniref:Endonuclease V n=1 Tax=Stylophora pistillata TaxID=50429 RepID=A0A2B4SKG1_STYPI|nr:Endonuclease V [Stylophora pistillata]
MVHPLFILASCNAYKMQQLDWYALYLEKIFASLEAYQNSSQNKNPFTAGTVNLAVRVHSPGIFHNLSYNWWFGDRTKLLNSCLSEALRSTQQSHNPIYISVGHKTGLETAVRLAHACCQYRIPEPIRQECDNVTTPHYPISALLSVKWSLVGGEKQIKENFKLVAIKVVVVAYESLPVSFHWCVSRHCNELHQRNCSPTLEHNDSCYLIVNHTFHNSGNFCVSVGVRNDVSNTNTSLVLQIPDDAYPINSAKRRSKDKLATGAVIAISAMCLFKVVPIVLLVRRWNHSKRDKTEKANFDFRDSDDISFSSVQLFERPCFPWCGNRTSINAEGVPLCDHAAGNKLYTL